MKMWNKKYYIRFILLFIFCIHFVAKAEENLPYNPEEDWGQDWFGGDFSDVECGEVIIHFSFSEEAGKIFGTCEEPISAIIGSEGEWWTYGGRDQYSDIIKISYDKDIGYHFRKRLPYGIYGINEISYLGNTTLNELSLNEQYSYTYQPQIIFEISKENPVIPIFVEFKKHEQVSTSTINGTYYMRLFDDMRKKGLNPYGKMVLHTEPENFEKGDFFVVELTDDNSQKIYGTYCWGKKSNNTYTAELYPGVYRICRVYYMDQHGNVLGEEERIKNYEFEVLPQSDDVVIDVRTNKNQKRMKYRWEEYGNEWFRDDFSDVECGEVVINISFSEDSREIFGTDEEPFCICIRSEGDWWTYGGSDLYSDAFHVTYDKSMGYQIRKKLPYGTYRINECSYLGKTTSNNASFGEKYLYTYQPNIIFKLSEEDTEIPVFIEFKKQEQQEEAIVINSDYYIDLYEELKEEGINPLGEVVFHIEPKRLDRECFLVVEIAEETGEQILETYYFGQSRNHTYTAEMFPGVYNIHRAYYIDHQGTVLEEEDWIKDYEFEVLPQSEAVEINFRTIKNPELVSADLAAETSPQIEVPEMMIEIREKDETQRHIRAAVYRLIAFMVLFGLIGGGVYCWRKLKGEGK